MDDNHRKQPVGRISVAPMMDWTDQHCRYFFRLLSPDVRLYTEMVVDQAILHGDPDPLLTFNPSEHPVALQLGGSEPDTLAAATRIAAGFGYDEINLNIGCPSNRVQTGRFGACLMAEPRRVADCVAAMRASAQVPVTVKTRIGIDDRDDYEFLTAFVETVAAAGCNNFIIHARKAILSGLSPKQNRTIPPLKYATVYRLKHDFPDLTIVLNGGIGSADDVRLHLEHVDGIMIGRKAYSNPYLLTELQALSGMPTSRNDWNPPQRHDIVRSMAEYAKGQLACGVRLHHITRHMLGLFSGQPAARRWRRYICEKGRQSGAGAEVLLNSLSVFDLVA
ncbi:MAG: tRNA dihydrouridine(20/20a) synthase DusA [Gammaproteobacteria bacterium]|jgi:tRNA-dihydrouridine synthase A|nr:tRNA dihydrouridine(20/20a) synthase DusA [Chromatiales bacterium]MDP7296571.1 tRNA dihydrouridine(20/20a) synthase DusA [Gammaproteobacteria bacterium]MDP7419602.1 tRNA dihydrouridine(20/20a) synthase DusA [Gammaproteobacteria bacterium]MDP7660583.1 tRNA dihydrouridine(20/20a) synthase DusA [Gammaproteobacteria bacterium]HJP39748.1 tRNA dihydrouridine(20/20a) synthase DusA [Gammaproteobacteria bacterium]